MSGLDDRGLPPGYPFRSELETTPRQTRDGLANGTVFLIDCRTPDEHRAARIEGATLIPLDQIPGRAEDLAEQAGTRTIVIHCHMGGRSMKAALFLRSQGVAAVSMAGGIDLWSVDIDNRIPRY